MIIRQNIRTARTLWRVYTHRRSGHVLSVDPGAVICHTCQKTGRRQADQITTLKEFS